jgi:preprotein translocase subunit SecF
MTRFFANANYDFIGLRKFAYGLTAAVIVPGLVWILFGGLNYSIEFTGGTLVQVQMAQPSSAGAIRSALDRHGLKEAEIQQFGSARDYTIRVRLSPTAAVDQAQADRTSAAVDSALTRAFGAGSYTRQQGQAVGPKVGGELRQKAFLAILLSFAATLVYLAFRFEFRFGVAATIATAHDILTTLAFIRYLNLEVSLVVVAAILTVVGYSLNDTIIIFDRVRENLHKYKRDNLAGILNRSINETLPRSVLTHGTTMATTLALLIFAGEVIRPFAWVMTFGIFTGTFSSIYIAGPVLLAIEHRWPGKEARGVRDRVAAAGGAKPAAVPAPEPPREAAARR